MSIVSRIDDALAEYELPENVAKVLRDCRCALAEPDIISTYSGAGGQRDWVSVGTWLRPGQAVAVIDWDPSVLVSGDGTASA